MAILEDIDDDPIFRGIDGNECEVFINTVRRKARAAGKLRDNDWIMDLVSTSLMGEALRWHMALEPSVRDNWDALQKALLAKYPMVEGQQPAIIPAPPPVAGPSTLPIPAAAPPPPATSTSWMKSFTGLSLSAKPVPPGCGYIRVECSDSKIEKYLAADLDYLGMVKTCPTSTSAMIVKLGDEVGSGGRRSFELQPPRADDMTMLGALYWKDTGTAGVLFTNKDGVSGVKKCSFKSSSGRPQYATIWEIGPDSTVTVKWPGETSSMVSSIHLSTKTIWCWEPKKSIPEHYTKVRFYWEPINI